MQRQLLFPVLSVFALTLALGAGCKHPPPDGTNPPGDTAGSSGGKTSGSGGGSDDGGGGDDGGEPEPAVKECAAETSDTPTELFGELQPGRVLVRLPKNTNVYAENPFLHLVPNAKQESTCEVIVPRMAFFMMPTDAKKDPKTTRDEFLTQLGLTPNDIDSWEAETANGRNYQGVYNVGEGPNGEPPIKGLFVLKEAPDITVLAIYEAHPNAWLAIKNTFTQSAAKLLIIPKK